MEVLLNGAGVEAALVQMAKTLTEFEGDGPWAIVGIRRGGEPLAKRLAAHLETLTGSKPALGMVDITLYRDDGFGPHDWPEVGSTKIEFALKEHTVVLVDDVLYTGRTVRAAIDALLDFGRPKALRLAVLVDRGLRELPIRPDAVGLTLDTRPEHHVQVVAADAASEDDRATLDLRPPEPQKKDKH